MFTINGMVWRVEMVPPHHNMLKRADGVYTLGSCDNKTKTVYVNNMLNDYMLRKVLCHEVTHAAMFSYNILLTIDQEELLADLIATYGTEIIDVADRVFRKLAGIAV